ncbi:hypothetical protein AB0L49_28380 [Streptomyces antimycoticus]|uniref:hypothetical protein n=1 Tax=Streptomyces antimycoticus TaxID=68175 RepID=UPI00341B1B39
MTRPSASVGRPRQHNPLPQARSGHEALVLRLLREHGPLPRGQLGALCGLARTTVYDVVGALMVSGTVVASVPAATRRKRGRGSSTPPPPSAPSPCSSGSRRCRPATPSIARG